MAEDSKVYVPKQHVRRGVAGYKGKNVVIVDKAGKAKAAATKSKRRGSTEADD